MNVAMYIDTDKEFVVPADEYLQKCRLATRYEIIRSAVRVWENHNPGNDALRYELIRDLLDRWERGKTGEFTRREGREE